MENNTLRLVNTLGKSNQRKLLRHFGYRNINEAVSNYTNINHQKYSEEQKNYALENMKVEYNNQITYLKNLKKQEQKEAKKRLPIQKAIQANIELLEKLARKN